MLRAGVVVVAGVLGASVALGGDGDQPQAGAGAMYDGFKAVHARPSAAQIEQIRAIEGVRLVSCIESPTGTDYIAAPGALAALDAIGLDYDVMHENVQQLIDAETARIAQANQQFNPDGFGVRGGTWYDDFKDLSQVLARWDGFVSAYPSMVSRQQIGTSIEGRPLWLYTFTGPGDDSGRDAVLFNGTCHAREWISPMTVTYIGEQLLETYGSDPRATGLLDNLVFYVVPVMNPDGFNYTWGPDRYWRKNRRNNGNGTFGVDWNRNWGYGWGGPGSSGFSDDETYRGTAPFSEPESQALRDFILAHPEIRQHIDWHSYSQLILRPFGDADFHHPPEPDNTTFVTLSNAMSAEIGSVHGAYYDPIYSYELYLAAGTSTDWVYGTGDVSSFTIELRPSGGGLGGFSPPPSEIRPTGEECYQAVLLLAEAVRDGVSFSFPGGVPGVVEADTPTNVSVNVTPAFSGPINTSSGEVFWRTGMSGVYQSAAMSYQGNNIYAATLPAVDCGDKLEFYFSVDGTDGSSYTSPSSAPDTVYSADSQFVTTMLGDNFESDLGWSVSGTAVDGQWTRGVPVNGNRGDPSADGDGSGRCYVTDNVAGNSDVDDGETVLTSPVIDMTGGGTVSVRYWVGTISGSEPGAEDYFRVQYATNAGGTNWTTVLDTTSAAGTWTDLGFVVPDTSTLRVRFAAADNSPGDVLEAGVDGFLASRVEACPNSCAADFDGDGDADGIDIGLFLQAYGTGNSSADMNGDGMVNGIDVGLFLQAYGQGC